MTADDRLPDPWRDEPGLAPPDLADAARLWHALHQLGPAEVARAVAALDLTDLRRLVLTSLAFRTLGFSLRIEDGGLVVRSDDLATLDAGERENVRRGLRRWMNSVTEAELPDEDGSR